MKKNVKDKKLIVIPNWRYVVYEKVNCGEYLLKSAATY